MKYQLSTGGTVTLNKADFLASGGEGSVYRKAGRAYKIYTDPTKMIPVAKIRELSSITDANVIKPEAVLLEGSKPVGYDMRFVGGTVALCSVIPRVYRDRNGLTHDTMLKLVLDLRKRVAAVHDAGILVVDLNEMNVLVSEATHEESFLIDVDSFQTRSFPATAIMLSVRDWSVKGLDWTQGSDWFSFAVLAFQLFTGIHPYKGKHPSISKWEDRMKVNASVFDPTVRIPNAAYPVAVIPGAYRPWLEAVLQRGQRIAPPLDAQGGVVVIAPRSMASGGLIIQEVYTADSDVRGVFDWMGHTVVWTDTMAQWGPRRVPYAGVVAVAVTSKGTLLGVQTLRGALVFHTLEPSLFPPRDLFVLVSRVTATNGRLYALSGERVLEVELTETGGSILPSARTAAQVLPHASKLYEGCVVEDLLGSCYVSLFPKAGFTYQVRIPALEGKRVLEAKFCPRLKANEPEGGVLMAVTESKGRYDRHVFRFDTTYSTFDHRMVTDVQPTALNMQLLSTGICVCMNEEEELEVFPAKKDGTGMKIVKDAVLGADMRLTIWQDRLAFIRGRSVYSMRMA